MKMQIVVTSGEEGRVCDKKKKRDTERASGVLEILYTFCLSGGYMDIHFVIYYIVH